MAEIISPKSIEVPKVEPKAPAKRVPFSGFSKKLEVFFPEGSTLQETHFLYWFNDDGSRIQRAIQAGYEFVSRKEVAMNETIVPLNEDIGDRVSRVVGSKADGKPMYCFLMKLPIELRRQDEAAYAAEVDATDDVIRRGVMGAEGLSRKDAEATYVPTGGIKYDPRNPEISKRRG